jgi:hypothetical protein
MEASWIIDMTFWFEIPFKGYLAWLLSAEKYLCLLSLHRQLVFLLAMNLFPVAVTCAHPAGQPHFRASLARAANMTGIARIRTYASAGLGGAKTGGEANHRRQCKFPHPHYPRVAWLLTYPLFQLITVA